MSWTDERIATLRRMWCDEGATATEIAAAMPGTGFTRSSILGKAHRLKLPQKKLTGKPASLAPRTRAAPSPRPAQPRTERSAPQRPTAPAHMQPMPMPVEVAAPDPSTQVTLMGLTTTTCRWPQGDPASEAFRYCGAHHEIEAGPYCCFHARIAYTPQGLKRKTAEGHAAAIRDGKARAERLRRAEASAWL